METSLKVINNTESACGSCLTARCGTCAPAPAKTTGTTLLTRRQLGRAALAAAATSVLAGCSGPQAPQQPTAEKSGPIATPAPAPLPLSPELDVVQKAKGPIMTALDEFYKMGPGPSSSHTSSRRISLNGPQRLRSICSAASALRVRAMAPTVHRSPDCSARRQPLVLPSSWTDWQPIRTNRTR